MVGAAPLNHVRQFLQAQSTLTLATLSPEDGPAAADLYFVADSSLNLYFLSEPKARHARNLAADPRVAATVHPQAWDWVDIKGVQLEGVCLPVSAAGERAAALALYGAKFAFVSTPSASGLGTFLAAALGRHTVYRITPGWIRWLDNSVAFGHKLEWVRQDGEWVVLRE
jgi:uncharacterized protein YhbP (UPF0306 family)